jgi:hypothetical protein
MRPAVLLLLLLLAACRPRTVPYAVANLMDPQGRQVGVVALTQRPDGVEVQLSAWNLPPGAHAFQLRRGATCDGGVVAHELPKVDVPPNRTLTLTAAIPGAQLAPGRNGLLSSALAPDGSFVAVGSVACGPLGAYGECGSKGTAR